LIIASIGIYYWSPGEIKTLETKALLSACGEIAEAPAAVMVPDTDPFYPLIVTPLAVHYDSEGNQIVAPLYVENPENPSRAVVRARDMIGKNVDLIVDGTKSPKEVSLDLASNYWERSNAALLIKDNQEGYSLGLVATPLASYMSIPVIVTDEIDRSVESVLNKLGVKYVMICGNLSTSLQHIKFSDIDEIIDLTIDVVEDKFGDVEYITLANPLDAWPPKVLDKKIVLSQRDEVRNSALMIGNFLKAMKPLLSPYVYTFTIPEDYKYALVKLDIKNLEPVDQVEKFEDNLIIQGSFGYLRTYAYPGERDSRENLIHDMLHFETVYYDQGGEELWFSILPTFMVIDSAEIEVTVTVEKLSNPYYPLIPKESSLAQYLTAYNKGILFAKPEFAFAADDDVKMDGKTLPGNTQPFLNPALIPLVNKHVYENIHIPLNKLLAKIRDIDLSRDEMLRESYCRDPVYIALVGDTTMLPQYYYRNPHSDPFKHPVAGAYATNTPSDFIYGNIDPEIYSLRPYPDDYLENDMYSQYPFAENIVGRIMGWDSQDISALIARTIFYYDVIDKLGDWKNKASFRVGAGTDVQKLPIITGIRKMCMMLTGGFIGSDEPMKFPSGEKYFLIKRVKNYLEEGGFEVSTAHRGAAGRTGYTNEMLREIWKDNPLLHWILIKRIKLRQGYQNIDSFRDLSWWSESLFGDSSSLVVGEELEENSNFILADQHAIWFEKAYADILLHELGFPFGTLAIRVLQPPGLRTPIDQISSDSVRNVVGRELGPSVMMIEGCGSGKIDCIPPKNTLANAYLHAGVNAYISPTTLSAFYGALEPRPNFGGGVGLGIMGFMKTWYDWKFKGELPEPGFNEFIFEYTCKELFAQNVSLGKALRDAKNAYLPAQFNYTYRWTPPLSMINNLPYEIKRDIQKTMSEGGNVDHRFPVEKYATVYQINLIGDPAFNPYEPCNEGAE
ncbi:MAG TPA: hypothetical protein ENG74_00795, partial [Thermoplasmatales archaeon]|nr:hypothetical protein [Thermoplasmatales archaeon]